MDPPEFMYFSGHSSPENSLSGDHFIVDDLLDFSNDDTNHKEDSEGVYNNNNSNKSWSPIPQRGSRQDRVWGDSEGVVTANSTDSSTVTVVESCNSSFSGADAFSGGQYSGDLSVPYEQLAELEWLSNFVEESFSNDDLPNLQLISSTTRPEYAFIPDPTRPHTPDPSSTTSNSPVFNTDLPVPGKARTKRSRATLGSWTSRSLLVSPKTFKETKNKNGKKSDEKKENKTNDSRGSSCISDPLCNEHRDLLQNKTVLSTLKQKLGGEFGEVRRCQHCATEKTPQWRTGPMGPKTLCNACGVRFKSGRLVPEYRPAASPTFVLTQHSNSHRKVMELRRQKEVLRREQPLSHDSDLGFDTNHSDEFLIHHHLGSHFRELI